MSWKLRRGFPKTVAVTQNLAEKWAKMDQYTGDRALKEIRLTVYEREIMHGTFRPPTWARIYCRETGGWYRVNGKHTSHLFSKLDGIEKKVPVVIIEDYDGDTLADVARLYSTFDSKMQSRSVSDINHSFASTIPELIGFDRKLVDLCVGALAYEASPTRSSSNKQSPQDRAEALFDNIEICMWLKDILSSYGYRMSRKLWRVATVACMVTTYHKDKDDATEFWKHVREEDGPTPKDPDRKLASYLTEIKMTTTDSREVYVKCIHAWNAWRNDESTDLKYFPGKDIPKVV